MNVETSPNRRDGAPKETDRDESTYAVQGGGIQREGDVDTASPPAMLLRSGRKKRKERDSVPSSPGSASTASKSRKKSKDSLSADTTSATLEASHRIQHAPIPNAIPPFRTAGRRLSDVSLPSHFREASLGSGFSMAAASSASTTGNVMDSNPLLGADRRPPSTPMELAFGDNTSTLHALPDDEQRDEGRRDGLSQVLLRQTTQSSLKIMSQNAEQPPPDDGPTLFTTHSSILRPLPTRPTAIMSETSAPTTLPTTVQTESSGLMDQPVPNSSESSAPTTLTAAATLLPTAPDSAYTKYPYHLLQDWKVWAFLFAGAHILFTSIFHQQQYILPFWKSIPQRAANQAVLYEQNLKKLGLYKDPIVVPDPSLFNSLNITERIEHEILSVDAITEKPIIMDASVSLDLGLDPKQIDLLYKRLLLQEYRKIKSIMQDAISTYGPFLHDSETHSNLPKQVEDLQKKIQTQMKILQEWEESLAQVEMGISTVGQALMSSDSKKRAQVDKNSLKKALIRLKNVSPVPIDECDLFLLDIGHTIENLSWNKICKSKQSGGNDGGSVSLLSRTDFEASKERLMKYAITTADKLAEAVQSNKVMDEIIRSTVDTLKQSMIPYEQSQKTTPTVSVELHKNSAEDSQKYLTPDAIRSIIDERLEKNKADFTGKLDYASIRSGAKIIRTGPRQTSSSLSEDVPLVNRFLAISKLRFYGHKAEAALTPTYPRNTLGQCWSFVKETNKRKIVVLGKEKENSLSLKYDVARGSYATLSVRLASQVLVSHVVVEHPIQIASSATSAIQRFRVFGFEDDNASSPKSWYLGSFTYDIYGSSPLQEFPVSRLDADGQRVPSMRSVVLAVDSNWGAEFSCLYRFRVHGE